ncbi:endonuclease/exonuclease/phosphatase family protein [Paracoccus chinensis]|uniref:Endonuclease/Exonuclease/phosphatase family protein n=1 Tax=Paracoccus chinensis TaxID=525640 RepID=A0A1G9KS16_9RHOB|nr:endonuclease/exonuclease/phosphatase family protein [Paracoccus chinensis]SDL52518.1 Endonuclease/Exonuclease/phosphatase family protein [Paracoccus chinensis]
MGLRALTLALALAAGPALADTIRIATYSPDLSRDGPGLLLRDILSGKDEQIAAVVQVIAAADADVLLLTGFDWDHDGATLSAFADLLEAAGAGYPHRHASRPNSGMATGLDLDGDGRTGTGDDAQGFGLFSGQGGMVLLSRLPLGEVTDHSGLLWRDMPGNLMPKASPEVDEVQRLSSTAHWEVPVSVGGTTLTLMAWSATPPIFDGPEDRNGRRNHDEAVFWLTRLPPDRFVLMGDTNLDPVDGDGRREGIAALLDRVQDPRPKSEGAALAPQDGANAVQKGDPALDTADWPDADGPGNLRVDVVLPSPDLTVTGSGVLWPAPGRPLADTVAAASRHRLAWVDLELPLTGTATAASSPRPSP